MYFAQRHGGGGIIDDPYEAHKPKPKTRNDFLLYNKYVQRNTGNPYLYGYTIHQPKTIEPMGLGNRIHAVPPYDWRRLNAKDILPFRYVNAPIEDVRENESAEFGNFLERKLFPSEPKKSLVELARGYFETFDKNFNPEANIGGTMKSMLNTSKSMGLYQPKDERMNPSVYQQILNHRARLAGLELPSFLPTQATPMKSERKPRNVPSFGTPTRREDTPSQRRTIQRRPQLSAESSAESDDSDDEGAVPTMSKREAFNYWKENGITANEIRQAWILYQKEVLEEVPTPDLRGVTDASIPFMDKALSRIVRMRK